MKKIYTILAVAAAMMQVSCGDSFLEQDPDLLLTDGAIYSNAERIEATMNGVYSRVKSQYFLGGYAISAGDNRSDDFINGGNNGYTLMPAFEHVMDAGQIPTKYYYQYAYVAINAANTMILNLEQAESLPISNEQKDQYIQNCKFIRALSWYYLCTVYAQPYNYDPNATAIVMHTEAIADASQNITAASTISEVYQQILKDTDQISAMPQGDGDADCTRPTQAAAHMLRMRVFMGMNQWDNAIAEGNQVTGYTLSDRVRDMYVTPYATKETIFSMPFADTDRGSNQYHPASYVNYSVATIDTLDTRNGIYSKAGYNLLDKDSRWWCLFDEPAPGTGKFYQKYADATTFKDWLHIFRYAETLLNLAECYSAKGDDANAIACLKEVRERSIAPADDVIDVTSLSGAALQEAIYNERRLEFLGEGMRGIDIWRRAADFVHSKPGSKETYVIATPSNRSTYCWFVPQYEVSINTAVQN